MKILILAMLAIAAPVAARSVLRAPDPVALPVKPLPQPDGLTQCQLCQALPNPFCCRYCLCW